MGAKGTGRESRSTQIPTHREHMWKQVSGIANGKRIESLAKGIQKKKSQAKKSLPLY